MTPSTIASGRAVLEARERTLAGRNGQANGTATAAGPGLEAEDARDPVLRLNKEHALVLLGDKPVVMREGTSSEGKPEIRLLSIDGFKQWMLPNKVTRAGADGVSRQVPVATLWLASPERRQFDGICFEPGAPAGEPRGYYNLWRGFAVEPDPDAGSCARLLDHVYENVCRGDDALFAWVIGWFAAMVQRPAEKLGTSLVLRGAQGTGKTIVGKAVGSLLGPHYTLVADPRYITGRFNSHLVSTLLLQADEGFWAGDHTAEGILKDLVTGDVQLIEYKGREPVRVRNHVRLLITSNAQWIVPAGLEERRFAVLDVGDDRRQDHAYFGAIEQELAAGGREALLAYLLAYDTSAVPLRQVPATGALYEQKVKSLTAEEQWWYDVLRRGQLPGDRAGAGITRCADVYDHYIEHAQRVGVPRRAAEVTLGSFLTRRVPALVRRRRAIDASGTRHWAYEFPSLAACRQAFDASTGQDADWGERADEATWTATEGAHG